MSERELAAKYNASTRTIRRWKKLNAPFHDPAAMDEFIKAQRSRLGVSKLARRSESAPLTPVREVAAEIVPAEPLTPAEPTPKTDADSPEGDDEGTLRRLEAAERTAYKRYLDTGGSERAAQIWLLVCDQKRKLIADQQKQTSDVSESETKFLALCADMIMTLGFHLKALPRLLALLCDGLGRAEIEVKAADQIERTVAYAAMSLADQIRGTSLETFLPAHGNFDRTHRTDRRPSALWFGHDNSSRKGKYARARLAWRPVDSRRATSDFRLLRNRRRGSSATIAADATPN
jgi:hypothetical protein